MGDLISRQWMIDHCFLDTDKELARKAPDVDAEPVRHEWISTNDRIPENFVPVLGWIEDELDRQPVRECYTIDDKFFFPALRQFRKVSHWMPMPIPPSEEPHDPTKCRYYTPESFFGRDGGCLGTREIDPCKGANCKRFEPKEDGEV